MRRANGLALILVSGCLAGAAFAAPAGGGDSNPGLDAAAAARFAGLALKCLHAEYPNHISHTLDSDADARPPHVLTSALG